MAFIKKNDLLCINKIIPFLTRILNRGDTVLITARIFEKEHDYWIQRF